MLQLKIKLDGLQKDALVGQEFLLGVATKLGHLLAVQQRVGHFQDVFALLWSLLNLSRQKEACCCYHPAVKLLEALQHEEAMEEHDSSCYGVIATEQGGRVKETAGVASGKSEFTTALKRSNKCPLLKE